MTTQTSLFHSGKAGGGANATSNQAALPSEIDAEIISIAMQRFGKDRLTNYAHKRYSLCLTQSNQLQIIGQNNSLIESYLPQFKTSIELSIAALKSKHPSLHSSSYTTPLYQRALCADCAEQKKERLNQLHINVAMQFFCEPAILLNQQAAIQFTCTTRAIEVYDARGNAIRPYFLAKCPQLLADINQILLRECAHYAFCKAHHNLVGDEPIPLLQAPQLTPFITIAFSAPDPANKVDTKQAPSDYDIDQPTPPSAFLGPNPPPLWSTGDPASPPIRVPLPRSQAKQANNP